MSASTCQASPAPINRYPVMPCPPHRRGGETVALARLKYYLWDSDLISTYFDTRNGMLGGDYSTKFAPWLAAGCISPRKIHSECRTRVLTTCRTRICDHCRTRVHSVMPYFEDDVTVPGEGMAPGSGSPVPARPHSVVSYRVTAHVGCATASPWLHVPGWTPVPTWCS